VISVDNRSFRPRLPDFLKQSVSSGAAFKRVTDAISDLQLNTVCEEAKCPNRTHCYGRGTLTFQILGRVLHTCLRILRRNIREKPVGPADEAEPARVVGGGAAV